MALPRPQPDSDRAAPARTTATPDPTDLAGMHAAAQAVLAERHYVQFHPAIAQLLGGLKPALMLGHALYWTRNWMVAKKPSRDGWFWKTSAEWRDATGLSTREQESAREVLRQSGIWHETLLGNSRGQGTRLHFRIDLAVLTSKLLSASQHDSADSARVGAGAVGPAVGLANQLPRLLARPVLYFRSLADVAGSATAGLLLSWLLTQFGEALDAQATSAEGFFLFDQDKAREALMLGAKALRNARDALERSGLVSIAYACESQGRLMVRVNLMALTACLSGQKPPARKRLIRSASPLESVPVQASLLDRGFQTPTAMVAEPAPSRIQFTAQPVDRAQVVGRSDNVTRVVRMLLGPQQAESQSRHRQDVDSVGLPFCRNGSPQSGLPSSRFVETGGALLSKPYTKGFSFSKEPPTPAQELDGPARRRRVLQERSPKTSPSLSGDGEAKPLAENLVLPKHLDAALHPMALDIVRLAPVALQQSLLDELEGTLLGRRRVIDNPLGWLHAVVSKANSGTLVLTTAHGVAASREAAKLHAQRASTATEGMTTAARPSEPGYVVTEAARAAQSRIAEVLARMKGKPAASGVQEAEDV